MRAHEERRWAQLDRVGLRAEIERLETENESLRTALAREADHWRRGDSVYVPVAPI